MLVIEEGPALWVPSFLSILLKVNEPVFVAKQVVFREKVETEGPAEHAVSV